MTVSMVHGTMPARNYENRKGLTPDQYLQLGNQLQAQKQFGFGQDADLTPTLTTPSIGTPQQFLQAFRPGTVQIITQARKADMIMALQTIGDWSDEEIVQVLLEQTGNAVPYQDHTQVNYSNWNATFERRTVVRMEIGYQVSKLEDARASKMGQSTEQNKQGACANALEITRNFISFFGYGSGDNRTFGLLNDPNLIGYINSPNGAAGFSDFARKTVNERIASILLLIQAINDQSGSMINPISDPTILAVASGIITLFNDINEFGVSLKSWMKENYPLMRLEPIPEFNEANGGASVIYLIAEEVPDSGTDGGQVVVQLIPTKIFSLGTEQRTNGYIQDYSNATAGIMTLRPYGISRMSGV